MDLTPANIRTLRTTFNKSFQKGYEQAETSYDRLTTQTKSNSSKNDYGWMAALPSMREWLGPRVVQNLAAHHYSLLNKTFELTAGVPVEEIEDDNLGVYGPVFEQFGEAAAYHPEELLVSLLQNGHAQLCFDSQNYFDTDHPVNPYDASLGVYSNYSASGMALDQTNFLAVRAAMMGYKGDGNRSLKVRPGLLIVPPALEPDAIAILKKETITEVKGSGEAANPKNVSFQMADYLVLPELAGQDTTWYLMDASRAIKPFVRQVRRALKFNYKNRGDDMAVIEENLVKFYADKRENMGYTLPFLCYKAAA